MADRKQFLGEAKVDAELQEMLKAALENPVDEAQLHEQRISFAFGNSPDSDLITKETVRRASATIRIAS